MKQRNTIIFLALLFSVFQINTLQAQDEGFIYGKVVMVDDNVYEGAIRWGKEEVYWTDMFNSSKEDNRNIDYLSRSEMRDLEERYYRNRNEWGGRLVNWVSSNWSNSNWNGNNDFLHQFSCHFGEIKKLRFTGRSRLDVELQNGEVVEVNGNGYNDIGTKVKVIDSEIGEIELEWDRIDMIEFMNTPNNLEEKFGEPLYGTVEAYGGTFTGLVQWDHDERVSTDKLDGDTEDGDVSISFGKIKSIEGGMNRSYIELKSGRKLTLRGSNDVNSENRGIVVYDTKLGRVDIPWREFKRVDFDKPKVMKTYKDFKDQKLLSGMVETRQGEKLSGRLIFDLDESYNFEVLQGKDDDIEYIIPFREIASISPKNYDYSTVNLKNGKKLILGEQQDVSDRNTGILVFEGKNEPVYINWEDVEVVKFN